MHSYWTNNNNSNDNVKHNDDNKDTLYDCNSNCKSWMMISMISFDCNDSHSSPFVVCKNSFYFFQWHTIIIIIKYKRVC